MEFKITMTEKDFIEAFRETCNLEGIAKTKARNKLRSCLNIETEDKANVKEVIQRIKNAMEDLDKDYTYHGAITNVNRFDPKTPPVITLDTLLAPPGPPAQPDPLGSLPSFEHTEPKLTEVDDPKKGDLLKFSPARLGKKPDEAKEPQYPGLPPKYETVFPKASSIYFANLVPQLEQRFLLKDELTVPYLTKLCEKLEIKVETKHTPVLKLLIRYSESLSLLHKCWTENHGVITKHSPYKQLSPAMKELFASSWKNLITSRNADDLMNYALALQIYSDQLEDYRTYLRDLKAFEVMEANIDRLNAKKESEIEAKNQATEDKFKKDKQVHQVKKADAEKAFTAAKEAFTAAKEVYEAAKEAYKAATDASKKALINFHDAEAWVDYYKTSYDSLIKGNPVDAGHIGAVTQYNAGLEKDYPQFLIGYDKSINLYKKSLSEYDKSIISYNKSLAAYNQLLKKL